MLLSVRLALSGRLPGFVVLEAFFVLHGQAPRGVFPVGLGATFGAAFDHWIRRSLQGASLFEAPVPSLFHVLLPDDEKSMDRRSIPPPAR